MNIRENVQFFHNYDHSKYDLVDFSDLIGKTFKDVVVYKGAIETNDEIHFLTDQDELYIFGHYQECCEDVVIEDIAGNTKDLIGNPIIKSEERKNERVNEDYDLNKDYDSNTWTFYTLATVRGWVDIRWHGASNGYYSERAYLYKIKA